MVSSKVHTFPVFIRYLICHLKDSSVLLFLVPTILTVTLSFQSWLIDSFTPVLPRLSSFPSYFVCVYHQSCFNFVFRLIPILSSFLYFNTSLTLLESFSPLSQSIVPSSMSVLLVYFHLLFSSLTFRFYNLHTRRILLTCFTRPFFLIVGSQSQELLVTRW